MAYSIDQFGFEVIDEIPVEKNDWTAMLDTFMVSDAKCIKKDFDGKSASNAAGAIRKAADSMGIGARIKVVTKKDVLYIQKI